VLAGTIVTSVGASTVAGNLGVYPGTSIIGFPPGIVNGNVYASGPIAQQAQSDASTARDQIAFQPCDAPLPADLTGLALTPGTYCSDGAVALSGTLTLDGEGVFVFRIVGTFVTAAGSSVVLVNGASACNVFYGVESSVNFGAGSLVQGTVISPTNISLGAGAGIYGRAIAINGTVTMDTNVIRACSLAPTAARVSVGGRVTNDNGYGLKGVRIVLTDSAGHTSVTLSSSFGYYKFEGLEVGQTVILSVTSRRYVFDQSVRVESLLDQINALDIDGR
jgi:hypothetical protein